MHVLRSALHSSALRLVAGAALSVLALTGCGLSGGETSIEIPVEAVTAVPVATTTALAPAEEAVDTVLDTGPSEEATDTALDTGPSEEATDTASGEEDEIVDAPDGVVIIGDDVETQSFELREGAECMEGRWITRPGELNLFMHEVGLLTGVEMHATGYLLVILEDGHYVYDNRSSTEITIDDIIATSVVDGVTQGSYEYDNGFIVAEQTLAEVDAYVDILGTRLDAGELGEAFSDLAVFHEVPFECGTTPYPVLYFETVPGQPRHDVHFEAWDGTFP